MGNPAGKTRRAFIKDIRFVPSVKKPKRYKGPGERILIPKSIPQNIRRSFDLNCDGYLEGSQERYKLWLYVAKLFTRYQRLRTSAGFDKNRALVRKARLMWKTFKKLKPLYAHLPQVNHKRQTVRVGGIIININGGKRKMTRTALFALGEAASAIPCKLRNAILRRQKVIGRIYFSLSSKFATKNWGMIYSRPWLLKRNRSLQIKSNYYGSNNLDLLLHGFHHEFGHMICGMLAFMKYKGKWFLWGGRSTRALSMQPMFVAEWRRLIKKTRVNPGKLRNCLYRRALNDRCRIRYNLIATRHTTRAAALINSRELFAESYAAYAMGSWSGFKSFADRDDLKKRNPFYYNFFKGIEAAYSHPAAVRTAKHAKSRCLRQ